MSLTETRSISCDCGAVVDVACYESVNADRDPALRDAVLARRLHVFACGACGRPLVADKRISYVDLGRAEFYGVAPERQRGEARWLAEELVASWHVALGDRAPASVRALLGNHGERRFCVRLCFGLEELREKIVARAAGLDDLALEVFKGELLASNGEWADAGVRTLRLDHVEPDGRLAFHLEQATEPLRILEVGILADRAGYDALAALPWRTLLERLPGVASGPHVSLLRLGDDEAAVHA